MTTLALIIPYRKQQIIMPTLHNRESKTWVFFFIRSFMEQHLVHFVLCWLSEVQHAPCGKKPILLQPRVNTTKSGLNTFTCSRYYGPKIWNSLTDDWRTFSALDMFVLGNTYPKGDLQCTSCIIVDKFFIITYWPNPKRPPVKPKGPRSRLTLTKGPP